MDNDLEQLRRLWPYLTDAGRETIMQFAKATAVSNGYKESSYSVFTVQSETQPKRELLGVERQYQRRALEIQQRLIDSGECPF